MLIEDSIARLEGTVDVEDGGTEARQHNRRRDRALQRREGRALLKVGCKERGNDLGGLGAEVVGAPPIEALGLLLLVGARLEALDARVELLLRVAHPPAQAEEHRASAHADKDGAAVVAPLDAIYECAVARLVHVPPRLLDVGAVAKHHDVRLLQMRQRAVGRVLLSDLEVTAAGHVDEGHRRDELLVLIGIVLVVAADERGLDRILLARRAERARRQLTPHAGQPRMTSNLKHHHVPRPQHEYSGSGRLL